MCGIAVNRLKMTPAEFYDFAPIELNYAIKDHAELEETKLTVNVRTIFESMRIQTALLSNMNPYVKKVVRDPTEVIKFHWDVVKGQTPEDMRVILQGIANVFNKKEDKK